MKGESNSIYTTMKGGEVVIMIDDRNRILKGSKCLNYAFGKIGINDENLKNKI